jgi:sulfite reductase (NADPH) flavoprotein alpha-component
MGNFSLCFLSMEHEDLLKMTVSVEGSVVSEKITHLAAASVSNPFGIAKDPLAVKGTVYATPLTLISSAIYANVSKVFSYRSIGNEDVALKLWSTLHRQNGHGVVPSVSEFEIRSGAGSALLGYLGDSVVPVVTSGNSLPYFQPTLSAQKDKLSFQVSALDYDDASGSLVSNYVTPLNVANALNYAVFTPLNKSEVQHTALLSLSYSQLQSSLNLYDGSYLKESSKFEDIISQDKLVEAYCQLKASVPVWKQLPVAKRPVAALESLNKVFGTSYKPFEYYGHKDATNVFVIYGSLESELFANEILNLSKDLTIGVIVTRIPLPFDSDSFISVIPDSTQSLTVIGQSLNNQSSLLKSNVNATIFLNGLASKIKVSEFIYSPTFIWSSIAVEQIVSSFVVVPRKSNIAFNSTTTVPHGDFIFWCLDNSKYINAASKIAHAFSLDSQISLKYRSKFDNEVAGGVYQAQISASAGSTIVGEIDSADLIVVDDKTVLNNFNVTKTLKPQGTIILVQEELASDLNEFANSLPVQFRRNVAKNQNKLIIIDLAAIGELPEAQGRTGLIAIQAIFWKYAAPQLGINEIVRTLWQSAGSEIELLAAVITSIIEESVFPKGIKEFEINRKWAELPLEENEVSFPVFLTESSFEANPRSIPEPDVPEVSTYVDVVKKLAFSESFKTQNNLRPDLPVRNFVVKVQENRRVTPSDYSRNIFHIEFDITGTGLTYDIGEALGVHGRNDSEEINRFIEFYGLDPNALIEVPNKDNNDLVETRTVFQAFTDNLDLLGKPAKRFYETLAPFAQDEKEKTQLEKLGSAEGVEELKKFQDIEFYSYTDVFELFPSARPSLQELVSLVPPLKRREYSIASSQKMHPNAVHLLIVVVDWVDARKRKRFGQCSRYLSELAIGSELVVSVKPSVMKLPPLSTQPIVMSGLGTGLAPFKAFVEEKIWQKEQGLPIGEIYLYLGARHRKEEYLYGELWEAYKAAGIITHIGAAFSRDQPEKIYIQDRIRQTLPELKDCIVKKNGSFYLCGPVWPVPDVTAALEDIVAEEAKERGVEVDAAHEVEEMKENSRYILEVY